MLTTILNKVGLQGKHDAQERLWKGLAHRHTQGSVGKPEISGNCAAATAAPACDGAPELRKGPSLRKPRREGTQDWHPFPLLQGNLRQSPRKSLNKRFMGGL